MPDALTTITKLINSPPGQLAAGGVLAGIVWKCFERIESVLTDNTKLEIAVWLLGRKKFGPKVQPWPDTFAKLFDRVFGGQHLSWQCFGMSLIVSLFLAVIVVLLIAKPQSSSTYVQVPTDSGLMNVPLMTFLVPAIIVGLFGPHFVALYETRLILRAMSRSSNTGAFLWICLDSLITFLTAGWGAALGQKFASNYVQSDSLLTHGLQLLLLPITTVGVFADIRNWIFREWRITGNYFDIGSLIAFPTSLSSAWLWLYAGSGFLLKAARRFDIGFEWFNRKFDIEKKLLQSIGLVAGALVAVVYWVAVIVSRVLS